MGTIHRPSLTTECTQCAQVEPLRRLTSWWGQALVSQALGVLITSTEDRTEDVQILEKTKFRTRVELGTCQLMSKILIHEGPGADPGHCWGQDRAQGGWVDWFVPRVVTQSVSGLILIPDVLVSPSIGQADVTLSQDWPHSGLLYLVIPMPCRLWSEHARRGARQHRNNDQFLIHNQLSNPDS